MRSSIAATLEDECPRCEHGLIECIVAGSASKTEMEYCSCPMGQTRETNHKDALEAKGEED